MKGKWMYLFVVATVLALQILSCLCQDQRPQYHFIPAKNWMNDPNGPSYYNGIYHLFFQYNPFGAVWGNMHWGHAVSKDLVNWIRLPVAIAPTPNSYDADGIFSGSMSFDPTTGNPIAIYTGVNPEVQCLAFPANLSDPYLTDWVKFDQNPIIKAAPPTYTAGFRDPTTSWMSPKTGQYLILVGSGNSNGGAALLYSSPDLIHNWSYVGPFFDARNNIPLNGQMWECPDFYNVTVNNNPNQFYIVKGSANALGYGDHYWSGKYNTVNDTFNYIGYHGVYDYGHNFYASKTFYDPVKARQILWGWIQEADSDFSSRGWAGIQSLPRHITVDNVRNDGSILVNPIDEITTLRSKTWTWNNIALTGSNSFVLNGVESTGKQFELQLEVEFTKAQLANINSYGVIVRKSSQEQTKIEFQPSKGPFMQTDLPGDDYLNYNTTTWEECEKICNYQKVRGEAQQFCRAWVLYQGHCFLKINVPNKNPNDLATSGIRELLIVNRTASSLSKTTATNDDGGPVVGYPNEETSNTITRVLRVFVDHSIVEVFANGGRNRITTRIYPTLEQSVGVEVFVDGLPDTYNIKRVQVWAIGSIWP